MGLSSKDQCADPSQTRVEHSIEITPSIINGRGAGGDLEPYLPTEEITEIIHSIGKNRTEELANVVRLGHTVTFRWEVTCLAAVIDIPATKLAQWKRFADELTKPPSHVISKYAYLDPPDQPLVAPGLSYPSRVLLSVHAPAGGTFGCTKDELAEKCLFSTSDIELVTTEMAEREIGSWRMPTLREAADRLTVSDLEPLLRDLPVKKSWTKARKLDVLIETCEPERLRSLVESVSPRSLTEQLFIQFKTLVPAGFHRAWAEVTGHYLSMCAYRNRDWNNSRTTLPAFGSNTVKLSVPAPVDECDRCKTAHRRASLDDRSTWPPFHLGCRCIANVEF